MTSHTLNALSVALLTVMNTRYLPSGTGASQVMLAHPAGGAVSHPVQSVFCRKAAREVGQVSPMRTSTLLRRSVAAQQTSKLRSVL
jgi:hypothetical protein